MTDAPRWPGADGSAGLSFARKNAAVGTPESDDDATRVTPAVDGSSSQAEAKEAASGSGVVHAQTPPRASKETADGGMTSVSPARGARSQSAGDWELDSITRADNKPARADFVAPAKAVSQETPTSASSASESSMPIFARGTRRTRKARLRLDRLDPWSVMKTAFLFSIAFGVMGVASVAVLWSVFAGSDTMDYINDFVNGLMAQEQGGTVFDIRQYLGWERVVGLTAVLTAINVVIFTAVATLFAFLYNLAAIIMGGLEVTLAED